jgi:hypothetical protein
MTLLIITMVPSKPTLLARPLTTRFPFLLAAVLSYTGRWIQDLLTLVHAPCRLKLAKGTALLERTLLVAAKWIARVVA